MNDLRSTDPDERRAESASGGQVIEFRTYIQDRLVSCRWNAVRVTGDAELIRRVERSAGSSDWRRSPTSVADAVAAAVACPVVIRVLQEPASRPLAGGHAERRSAGDPFRDEIRGGLGRAVRRLSSGASRSGPVPEG